MYSGVDVKDAAIAIWLVHWNLAAVERGWMLPQKWLLMAQLSELTVLHNMKITRTWALTNRMVLLQVVPLLKDKDGRSYRRLSGYQKTSEYKWYDLELKRSVFYYWLILFWTHDWFSWQIHPRSYLSLNCTLALWVYGMVKYENFTGIYLSELIKLSPHYFLRFSRLRHINKLVMLAARIFIASFAERRVLRGRIFEVWSVPSNKLHPFSPESFQFFLHLLIVRSASSAISPSSAFSFPTVIHIGLLFCT